MDHDNPVAPDPWACSRSRIKALAASCADDLGRITRSLERATDAHYVADKAHALRETAGLLAWACHEATLDAWRCGAEVEETNGDGESWTEECARPQGHAGPHSTQRPATRIERAAERARELAEHVLAVADRLAWATGPAGYDRTDDVAELERGLRRVERSLASTRSAVAALRDQEATGGAE